MDGLFINGKMYSRQAYGFDYETRIQICLIYLDIPIRCEGTELYAEMKLS